MSSNRHTTLTMAVAAAAGTMLATSSRAFVSTRAGSAATQRTAIRGAAGQIGGLPVVEQSTNLSQAAMGLAASTLAISAAVARRRSNRAAKRSGLARAATEYGEDLSVPQDSFCVVGLAHCFEQVEGKLQDVYVLEPVSASTVEVVNNGAETSYEAFVGVDVGTILAQDSSALPEELLCGHQAQWATDIEFRTGCAARTWMRDHARDIIRKIVPDGEVRTGFNTSTRNKRILNFVNEVKDSDNIKQDMSIDVYGREDEEEGGEGGDGVQDQIAELYNV